MRWPPGTDVTGYYRSASLADMEADIRALDQEVAGVFVDGAVAYAVAGSRDVIDDQTDEALQQFIGGSTVTHSHPDDDSFSLPDLLFAYGWGLRQLRAVGPMWTYVLDEPHAGWDRFDMSSFLFLAEYRERVLEDDVQGGTIKRDRKWHTFWTRVMGEAEIPYTAALEQGS